MKITIRLVPAPATKIYSTLRNTISQGGTLFALLCREAPRSVPVPPLLLNRLSVCLCVCVCVFAVCLPGALDPFGRAKSFWEA